MNSTALLEMKDCTCINLRATTRAVTRLYDELLRPSGIRVTQLNILIPVAMAESITVTDLARAITMEQTTLTRNLKVLEKNGLVRLTPGEDRRTRNVTLTEKGDEVLERAYPLWQEAQAKVLEVLGSKKLEALVSELSQLKELG